MLAMPAAEEVPTAGTATNTLQKGPEVEARRPTVELVTSSYFVWDLGGFGDEGHSGAGLGFRVWSVRGQALPWNPPQNGLICFLVGKNKQAANTISGHPERPQSQIGVWCVGWLPWRVKRLSR